MGPIPTPIALTSGGVSNTSNTATASISPGVAQLIIVAVLNKGPNNTTANNVTVNGLSITWHPVTTHQSSFSNGEWRMTMWVGLLTTAQSGPLTFDCGGQSQQSILWGVIQIPYNVYLDFNNPQNAIVQVGASENNSTTTFMTVSMGAFANINNATVAFFANDGQAAFTDATGQTTIINIGTSAGNYMAVFNSLNQTSISANFAGNNSTGKIALMAEIKAQLGAGMFFAA